MIIWAGKSSEDYGIIVEHYPKIITPRRRIEVQQIPGRSQDYIIDNESFENYDQSYGIFINAKEIGGLNAVMKRISDWLFAPGGYQRLEDNYQPDVFRMAYVNMQGDFSNSFNEYGRGTITFNCSPKKYFKMGDYPVELSSGDVLYNPSDFKAEPLITVTGFGSGTLTINNKTVSISDIRTAVTIDVAMHRVYNDSENRISTFTGKFEDLILTEENAVSWSGGITGVSIIPRWWTV